MKNFSIALIFSGLIPVTSMAVETDDRHELGFKSEFHFFMEVGVQSGGDGTEPLPLYDRSSGNYVLGVPYTLVGNWNGVSADLPQYYEDDVEAGGLYKLAAGVEIPLIEHITLMTSIGYQFDEVYGDLQDGSGGQGSFQYMHNTIELIPFYNYGRHRLGLGAEVHYKPKAIHKEYNSSFSLKTTYDFETAYGAVIRYDYLVNKHTSVGIKYTQIAYNFEKLRTRYQVGGAIVDEVDAACLSSCDDVIDADSIGVHLTYRF